MMNQDNLLLIVAIVAVGITIIGLSVTYNSLSVFNNFLTGFAFTENGTVVLTIDTRAEINITSANGTAGSKSLDWGSGVFDAGAPYALLVSNGSVVGGTWPNVTSGFVVENVGNLNVTLSISSLDDASTFLGGTEPLFQYNITDSEDSSCVFESGVDGEWKNFTTVSTSVCTNFKFVDTNDEINLNILVKIPNDGKTGELTNTIVLAYEGII